MPQEESAPIVVQIVTLGCAKNLVDAEVMCGYLAVSGICLTTEADEADMVLINTCSFIRDARNEAEETIKKALAWKRKGMRNGILRAVAVAGCLPQRNPKECAENFPEVDFFIGLDDIPHIPGRIKAFFSGQTAFELPSASLPTYLYDHTVPRITVTPAAFAYVKIAEGCDHRCAFCAIPGIRGRYRSRTPESVLEECRQLLAQGARELNFIAQDSSSYGRDNPACGNLAELLRRCDELPGDFWIRVLYTYPHYVSDELLEVMTTSKHVIPYLDIPLQHISDSVLRDMARTQDGTALRALLAKIRSRYPQMTLRTTMLVGFPGETDENFAELLAFVKEFRFDRLGAFAYSPEAGTPAMQLSRPAVPPSTAKRRRDALLAAQQAISLERNQQLVGQEMLALVEERLDNRTGICRSGADAPEVDQIIQAKLKSGNRQAPFVKLKITAASAYELQGIEVN